jgi:cell division protein FtsI/penicillin-binding protein 2
MLRVAAMGLLIALLTLSGRPALQETDLYAQATAAMLDRDFPSHDVDYLLLDVRTRQVIAVRWPRAETPVPVGSLLKPFVALAFAELHSGVRSLNAKKEDLFPAIICHGKRDGCWRSGGHGSMRLELALAQSCNAYFLALARAVTASDTGSKDRSQTGEDSLRRLTQTYGLPAPPRMEQQTKTPAMLIGVTPEWRVQPVVLARAYAELAINPPDSTTTRLLAGMKMAALPGGTAARAGVHPGGILAKTGTAPCVPLSRAVGDRCRANGDGLLVLMFPADTPKTLLLVRRRGTTGAMAAEVAGQMLTHIEQVHGGR